MARLNRCFLFLFLSLCTLATSCHAEPIVYSPQFKCSKHLSYSYGVCTHINRAGREFEYETRNQDIGRTAEVGATVIRTDFDWNVCQKDLRGAYNFAQHDSMLAAVASRNLQTVGILWPLVKGRSADAWLQYAANAVGHFRKNVPYWEVVNEVDLYYKDNHILPPEEYVSLLKRAKTLIRKKNRKATILCGSITDIYGDYVKELFRLKSYRYFDIMNVHWYANKRNPESIIQYLYDLGKKMGASSVDKPVWLTETGATSAPGWDSEDSQACKLPRLFLISYALGVDKVFWYKTRSNELSASTESHFGLWHHDYRPKKAYHAYRALVAMCPDRSTRPSLMRQGDMYIAKWKKPDGTRMTALWTISENRKVNLDARKFPAYDVFGQKQTLNETLIVSPSVVYIEGDFDCQNLTIVSRE